ncbi:MAG TPA: ABC transporter substrate-binding protein [Pseudonocardiaceae bacterium]|jgi:peptide/nickel transport system substrate-binding protein|nr:ABC transporter substrate-binding protein [Pseudonocardiaceae bacterium]
MKRKNAVAFAAICAGLSLLTACGSGSGSSTGGSGGSGGNSGTPAYNAGLTNVVNPSTKAGGTLNYALSNAPDSTDPGNTYYAYMWDFSRLYARPLLTFKSAPGTAGLQLAPALATGLGTVSADGLTWTYHIQPNVKFEDGSTITTKDVKYGIERSTNYAPSVLPNGPTYFNQYLKDPTYPGAFKDTSPDKMGLTSIDTPDATTIVFHLSQPFADFDYLVTNPQTAPVPVAKDTGAKYQEHPVSSGPYMFSSYDPNKGFTLVKNPNWSSSTDQNDKQLVNTINVAFNVQAADLDSRLLNGSLDLDLDGTGVQTAARAKILNSKSLQVKADDATTGFLWYAALNTQVAPLNNVDCRKAIEYAVNKTTQQTAYGGPIAGGDIASTVLPPTVVGYQKADQYNFAANPNGDTAQAKSELQKCGQPNGFSINISARGDRPKEVSAAQGIQESLSAVGIKAQIQQYPTGSYFSSYAGAPNFVHQHNLGILMGGWGADWPDGFGFLSQIADGRAIKAAGNSNLQEENNPQINQLLDKATSTKDAAGRNAIYAQIDQIMMSDAVILPEVYSKALLYRNPNTTNVFVTEAYGMYDYTQIGTTGS